MSKPTKKMRASARTEARTPTVAEAPAGPPAVLPGRTRALFWVATLLLPVLFFVLLEGGLRLGGYGGTYPLFVQVDEGDTVRMPNRDVARRYFAVGSFVPNPNPDFFARVKPENALRVVVQGGSSAAGYPYYRGASFPQVLGARLRAAYPEREVEIVNTAMAAVNSYTLLDFADEIVDVKPDAVLVYAGHNEYYGALGAASSEALVGSPGIVRAYLRLRRFRTVQLLRNGLAAIQRTSDAPQAGDGRSMGTPMSQMVGEQSVPLGSETYRRGLQQFEENLDALLARYEAAGIPVFVGTLASNERDQRPFVVATSPDAALSEAQRDAQITAALDQVRQGQAAAGIEALRTMTQADTLAADAPFALGRALLATGDTTAAAQALRRARDLDALRFRAPSAFNGIIRRVAAAHGATVVESEARIVGASQQGIAGRRLMLEHLHPNLDGYALLADAFFDALAPGPIAGTAPRPTPPGRTFTLITPLDSLAAAMRMDRLTRSWPFRPDEILAVDLTTVPPFVVQAAEKMLNGSDWLQSTIDLAGQFATSGDAHNARLAHRAAATAYPFLASVWTSWGDFELAWAGSPSPQPGRLAEAVRLYERAIATDPGATEAPMMLGAIRLQAGDAASAVPLLERATATADAAPQALYNLAGAYVNLGRWEDAERVATRLAGANPNNAQYQQFAEAVRRRTLKLGA